VKEAHDMIFAAQKDLLDHAESVDPEATRMVDERTERLKKIALETAPKRKDSTHAVEDLRGARTYLQSKVASAVTDDEETENRKKPESQNQAAEKVKAEMLGNATPRVRRSRRTTSEC